MNTKEFQKLYNGLNRAQKKAVDTIEGSVMVVAGPGTGKTQVLTLRIANILLKTQVNPENILALTFTEAAAYEMRKRLLSIIGQDAYRVDITTFHAFCNNFIKRHQEEFPNIIASESINEIDQLQIIEDCMESLPLKILRPLGDVSYYVKPVLFQINELKRENTTAITFEKALNDFEKQLNKNPDLYHKKGAHKGKMKSVYQKAYRDLEKNRELLIVYKEYQEKMMERKKYDYNDMLLQVIEKLERRSFLLQILQERYQYFLVDEHQDTNASQNKIVELICNYFKNPNLFVVGDEKQAIFRFQGATLENFLYFKNLYREAVLINLNENYRSTKTILHATHAVITNNPKSTQILSESEPLLKRAIHAEEKINIARLSRSEIEYFWVVEKIKQLLKKTPAHEITILARNNRDLFPFVTILDNEKIPYVVESDNNVLDDIDIQKFIVLLKAIHKASNAEFVIKAMFLDCFDMDPIDVFKIIRKSRDEKIPIWEILTSKKINKELDLNSQKEIESFVDIFMNRDSGFVKLAQNSRFDKVVVEVLHRTGLMEQIFKKNHAQEILARFTRLYDEVKEEVGKNPKYSLSDFLEYIDLLIKHDISLTYNTNIIPEGAVRLMTVHKSKGLEFDYVFIINAYDGHWGNPRKRGNRFNIPWDKLSLRLDRNLEDNENTDERRLFYVAMTRARKKVYISYSATSEDGGEQMPSQFLIEIPEEFVTLEDVIDFENEILSSREKLFNLQDKKINPNLKFPKEYIRGLFLRQGLSVTALNNYLNCPWRYFFVDLIRIPERVSDAARFGNAIHSAINRFIVSLKRGKKSKGLLMKYYDEEFYLKSISEKESERFYERGKTALDGFYEERLKHLSKDAETEFQVGGVRLGDITLNGKIDLMEPIDDGYVVTDFKTGKIKSRNQISGLTKNSEGNFKRQLVFYKILLDFYKKGFFNMKLGVIDFVEPNEKGQYKKEAFEITKEEVDLVIMQTKKAAQEIMDLSFWNYNCNDKECEYCKLRNFMLGPLSK